MWITQERREMPFSFRRYDEFFFWQHCEELSSLAALPKDSPKREEECRRMWALARKGVTLPFGNEVYAQNRDNPYANPGKKLLVVCLGLLIAAGAFGLHLLGVNLPVCLALGTLGMIALVIGARRYGARYSREQERDFRLSLDNFLECVRKMPPERIAQRQRKNESEEMRLYMAVLFSKMNRLFKVPKGTSGRMNYGCAKCGHVWRGDFWFPFFPHCPECGNSYSLLFISPGKKLTFKVLRLFRALQY